MLFNSWEDIFRVLVSGTLGYLALIFLLRNSGKRTLAKMNMFDFVITITLGSIFSTLTLSKSVALAEGATALALLIGLQYGVAWLSVRSKTFQKLVKGEPSLLFYRGQYLTDAIRENRVVAEEIRSAARSAGLHDMSHVGAIILETNGEFSVIPKLQDDAQSSLADIRLPQA